ncbi:hypothetical protein EJ05DRAFT_505114 [Pseudovirgaria hyperparasitica]|uniref:Uncharacterized protein n=1 Tax=Pseudovirgaria hyperparasitica TaxID=470096 RepID=A0A6A6VS18_9PEZI|nr:uncharacterized protein EJ05DRAFT_505114 [Pseudovirgaria hyperparasitica]KAF2753478.1 hypothetical protein EJ05DRAFT_505114 [Pseudovirgaria hyperparasitica]
MRSAANQRCSVLLHVTGFIIRVAVFITIGYGANVLIDSGLDLLNCILGVLYAWYTIDKNDFTNYYLCADVMVRKGSEVLYQSPDWSRYITLFVFIRGLHRQQPYNVVG